MNEIDIQILRARIRSEFSLGESIFEARWRTVFEDFKKVESGPIGMNASSLIVQLEMLRLLCNAFPEIRLKGDEKIITLVVPNAKSVGDKLTMPLRDGIQAEVKIVHRKVSDRFGICYTLETPDGSRFTREFFD